jgi:hypothetical protein
VVVAIDRKQIDPRHPLRISLFYPKFVLPRYRRPVVVTAPPLRDEAKPDFAFPVDLLCKARDTSRSLQPEKGEVK